MSEEEWGSPLVINIINELVMQWGSPCSFSSPGRAVLLSSLSDSKSQTPGRWSIEFPHQFPIIKNQAFSNFPALRYTYIQRLLPTLCNSLSMSPIKFNLDDN